MKNAWQGVKGIPKHLAGKGKKLLTNILSGGKEMFKGLRDRIKALFSKKKNKPDAIRNQDVLDADGAPSVNDRTPDVVDEGLEEVSPVHPDQKKLIDDVESGSTPLEGYSGHKPGNHRRKGNYGEAKADAHLEGMGYRRISGGRVTSVDQKIVRGIDGVFENSSPPPKYLITESKYGSSDLSQAPKDGPQMSDSWIEGSDRLKKSVGQTVADDMFLNGYDRVLVHVDDVGVVTTYRLNSSGEVIGTWP